MQLTPELEAELRLVLDTYWSSYLNGDIDTWASYIADEYHNIGTTEEEVWLSKQEIMDYTMAAIGQLNGSADMRNKTFQFMNLGPYIMVHELGDLYLKMEEEWVFYAKLRMSSLMEKRKDGWKILHQHGSYPDANAGQGDILGFEKIKHENSELREAVRRRTIDLKNKNRELEIEAALEKVRSVALSMLSPEDMLDICTAISQQLSALGIRDIRNVQTAIFYPQRGTYMNYEYYARHNKTFVTDVDYQNHPMHLSFALKMMKGPNEEVREHLKGQELIDWFHYQKTTNQFADEYLLTADSLNYYWFSLGPVALGTSTYTPLTADNIGLFKRFMKVFELAYQRYLDLEKAMQQAREAQIEAAMEKVRGRSLAMQEPDEIREVAELLRSEMALLGVEELETSSIYISEPEKATTECWYAIKGVHGKENRLVSDEMTLGLQDTWVGREMQKFLASGEEQVSILMKGDHRIEWINYCAQRSKALEGYYGDEIPERTYHLVKFANGFMGAASPGEISTESWRLLKRAAAVFSLAYTRFLDLRESAQNAREAQIELGLERVRAKTMAMYKSTQLSETAKVLFEQFAELGKVPDRMSIGIVQEESALIEWWATDQTGSQLTSHFDSSVLQPSIAKMFAGWKARKDSMVLEIAGDDLKDWIAFVKDKVGMPMDDSKIKGKRVHHAAYFSQGILLISAHERVPDETVKILVRFAKVFDQAYTRFLDLQKAEAQAKEAQIEAALERVRSRSLAMHHSSELSTVVDTLLQEFTKLEFALTFCIINLINGEDRSNTVWAANPETGKDAESYYMKFEDYDFHRAMWNAWKAQDKRFVYTLEGEEKRIYDEYLYTETEFRRFPKHVQDANRSLERYVAGFTFFKYSGLQTVSVNEITEADLEILERFGRVFEQAYTRFLDLQRAEAQTREAQIEAALERVRSRSLAMHKSTELNEVAFVLFEQVRSLGGHLWGTGFALCNAQNGMDEFWFANEMGVMPPVYIPSTVDEVHRDMLLGWQQKKEYFLAEKGGDALASHYEGLYALPQMKAFFDPMLAAGFAFPTWQQWHAAYFSKGYLLIITTEPYPEPNVFRRFAKVFDQAYTRFLDLHKAEAQTREGQIQLALERVRARAMAMQKSSELAEAAVELFQQVRALGIVSYSSGFTIWEKDFTELVSWSSNADGSINPPFHMPAEEYSWHREQLQSWKNKEEYIIRDFTGEDLRKHYAYLRSFPLLDEAFSRSEASGVDTPDRQVHNIFNFAQGNLMFITKGPVPESFPVFKRFAQTFEQCYTRFLDLQKAEAQAKEAQIEAALERVRSRGLGMQKSDELKEVIQVVYDQMVHLNLPVEHSGFILDYKKRDDYLSWIADHLGSPAHIVIPYFDAVYYNRFNQAKKEGEVFFAVNLDKDQKNRFYKDLFNHLPGFPEESKAYIFEQPALTISTVLLEDVALYIENFSGAPYSEEENGILMRFGKVFQQTYTRFLDLQKAEAQARESQIEAALERVRSKTMAMHSSADVGETAAVMVDELRKLGIDTLRCGIGIMHEPGDMEVWTIQSEQDGKSGIIIGTLDMHMHPLLESAFENWRSKNPSFAYLLKGDEMISYYQAINNYPGYPIRYDLSALPSHIHFNEFYFPEGVLFAFSLEALYESQKEIFKRFAGIFGQTYRRYLDLVKAEAQAREAQIEAALEKVRSRSLAMHRSEELSDLSLQLVKQVQHLGVPTWFCAFNIYSEGSNYSVEWGSNGQGTFSTYRTPREGIFLKYYEAGMRGETLLVNEIGEGECAAHYDYLCSLPGVGEQLLNTKAAGIPFPSYQIDHVAFFKYGYLLFITYDAVPAMHDIFIRFAKVFEQSYTRFLDLQKAEAQARESSIEAALERVRSKAMAMRTSEDIAETTAASFEELRKLGVFSFRSGVGILSKESRTAQVFADSRAEDDRTVALTTVRSMDEHPALQRQYDAWMEQRDFEQVLSGDELTSYYSHSFFKGSSVEQRGTGHSQVEYGYYFAFPDGLFYSWSLHPYTDSEKSILNRFRNIIALTFRRYLDLQKAEAQTREAEIALALERVRARTMAMQRSDELPDAASLLFQQIQSLGMPAWSAGYCLWNDDLSAVKLWMSSEGVLQPPFESPVTEDELFIQMRKGMEQGKDLHVVEMGGRELEKHYQYMRSLPVVGEILDSIIAAGHPLPSFQIMHHAYFSKGFLLFITYEPVPVAHEIFKRFAKVFDQTYTRFLDLQRAELQAKEATKQASLDRVRGVISGMRSAEDLNLITPLIFKELTILGVPFIRCGVFIIHEGQQNIEAYLSAPDGHSLGVLKLPFDASELTFKTVAAWRKNDMLIQHWNKEDFIAWTNQMVAQHQINDTKTYQGSDLPPESLELHFVPFAQGMLYVGTTEPLAESKLELIQSLARTFSIAYARYEDFVKLEKAKEDIETALSELKATQKQLIQSEKMASLGELTAGIAHEIQNPLNFVNNFSEVSKELIDEVKESLAKGDMDDAMEIMTDLVQNLERINEHGKRADSIVKGMLQHSRAGSGQKELTDINAMADECLRLAFHGLRAKDKSFNANFELVTDPGIGKVEVIAQDIGRVVLNLINNAFYAVNERSKRGEAGYKPLVKVTTEKTEKGVRVRVEDNGDGIPEAIKDKIFQPFFTTKPTGQGTGLGLSLSYDIVKAHGGELKVDDYKKEGSEFIIQL